MILATAFALATFGTAAWANSAGNRKLLAQMQTGAPAVIDTTPTSTTDLGSIVDRLDPGGSKATAVDNYFDVTGNDLVVLGVQPDRFARIAYWRSRFAGASLASLTRQLTTTVAPDVELAGDAIRLHVVAGTVPRNGVELDLEVDATGESDAIDVVVGTVTDPGPQTTKPVELVGCRPCQLRSIVVALPTEAISSASDSGKGDFTVTGIDVRQNGQWHPVQAGLTDPTRWRSSANEPLTATAAGLHWQYEFGPGGKTALQVADLPVRVPALVAVTGFTGTKPRSTGSTGSRSTSRPLAAPTRCPASPCPASPSTGSTPSGRHMATSPW